MPPRIRKDFAEYLMPTIESGVQSGMYTRDRSTDYGISVAQHMTYALQHRPTDARVKTCNTTNLKKPSGTPGGCLRLPVYGRLSLVFVCLESRFSAVAQPIATKLGPRPTHSVEQ